MPRHIWAYGDPVTNGDINTNFARLDTISVPFFHPGQTTPNENLRMISINYPTTIPANLAGTTFLSLVGPQGNPVFRLLTYKFTAWTPLVLLTISSTGNLVQPTIGATNLVPGDALWLQGPTVPDTTLADFSFNFLLGRT